ncbi:MAG: plastocyanin/azurin family copper-binding protein [Chloroflexota bacterium]|nr:plastocyanin/azurin family copper-binding protein [Chloroflexota bacterium]
MSRIPRLSAHLPVALFTLAVLAAGCVGGTGPAWTFAPLGPTPGQSPSPGASPPPGASPGTSPTPGGSPSDNLIDIEETADLRILRDGEQLTELQLAVGEEYTFRVTNTAGFPHNFYLGPPERLAVNDVQGLPGVPDFNSGTQEFTWTATAEAEGWQFACTVPGHYGPMHGEIVLEGGG